MLKIIGLSILTLVGGYVLGLVGGMLLVNTLSSNTHDRSVEAAMTAAFLVGPITAVLALAATLGYVLARPDR